MRLIHRFLGQLTGSLLGLLIVALLWLAGALTLQDDRVMVCDPAGRVCEMHEGVRR